MADSLRGAVRLLADRLGIPWMINWARRVCSSQIRFLVLLGCVVSGSNSVVECQLPKLDVAGSTPVSRSNFSRTYVEPIVLQAYSGGSTD